jgi:hypothetical protein
MGHTPPTPLVLCGFGWLAHSRNSRLLIFTEDTPLIRGEMYVSTFSASI